MKNIHILPTDKPSNLLFEKISNRYYTNSRRKENSKNVQNQNIYITSDEEIKEGDWFIFGEEILKCTGYYSLTQTSYVKCNKGDCSSEICKKIILTTDQDLIDDGVQAITDEFLKWLVMNPTCEEVEVVRDSKQSTDSNGFLYIEWLDYKIIIPKEEPKQETLEEYTGGLEMGQIPEKQENCCTPVGHIRRYKDCIGCDRKSKQETLEEASREYYKRGQLGFEKAADTEMAFLRGAKWQQERMYSIIDEYINDVMGGCNLRFEEWFEQFKNK